MNLRIAFALSCAAFAAGCDNRTLELDPVTSPPRPVDIHARSVTIPVGVAVAVQARVFDGSDLDREARVELAASPHDVLGVDRGLDRGTFVLYGMHEGSAKLEVTIDGSRMDYWSASVRNQ